MPISQLNDELDRWGFAYLLTVGADARPHVIALRPTLVDTGHGPVLGFDVGDGRAARNAAVHRDVTLVFPPAPDADGMSLIVDGRATVVGGRLDVVPTGAVLHRAAPAIS